MGKCTLHWRPFIDAALALLLIFCMPSLAPARADEYQEAITKVFPGFQILSRSEFTEEIQKSVKTHPALVTGRFNDDDVPDFAAIIRAKAIQRGQQGVREHYQAIPMPGAGRNAYIFALCDIPKPRESGEGRMLPARW